MKSKPLISILMPVWNGMPFIEECVESVLMQEYQDWELIISDNGSTDGTRNYLDSLQDSRIRVFKQERNLGIMGNVNFLFQQAKASVSQILCADDYFVKPTSLSKIAAYWEKAGSDIGFVRFGHQFVSDKIVHNLQSQLVPRIIHPDLCDMIFFVFGNIPGNLSDVSVRTHLILEAGGFNESMPFAGDHDMWSRIGRSKSIGIEKELLIYIRRHENVASNYLSLRGELLSQHLEIYKSHIDHLSESVDQKKLIEYFHFQVFAFHYRNAIKSALSGRFGYLNRIINSSSPILWSKWKRLIYCLPFALFNSRQRMTYHMARSILNESLIRQDETSLVKVRKADHKSVIMKAGLF